MIRKFLAPLVLLLIAFSCVETETSTARWPYGVKYEIFLRAFADGNGDGIGDLRGLTAKLDYLKDLGINGIWLMPVMKSPSYHKYDVVDYKSIDPEYGTSADFKELVTQAHRRKIKIILDFVVNHTSISHPWFKSAITGDTSPYRNYYVWAKKESVQREIAKKKITLDSDNISQWHPVNGDSTGDHYYGFFSSQMPDLNFDNPSVREEFVGIGKYWLTEMGVDGFRLDAARHIYPNDRATDNHLFWIWFRTAMKKIDPDVYLVGEVWANGHEAAPFLKGLPSVFNFELSNSISQVVSAGVDTLDLVNRYQKVTETYLRSNADFIDATFLKNHDQNRILSIFNNHIGRAFVAAGILLTLPGTPFIYYGEEIGMKGVKPDENIREPFVWDYGKGDALQTSWRRAEYSNDHTVVPLRQQKDNSSSLFNYYKALICYRNSSIALTRGTVGRTPLKVNEIVSFMRIYEQDQVLVLNNISDVEVTLKMNNEISRFKKIDFDFSGKARQNGDELMIPAYTTVIMK